MIYNYNEIMKLFKNDFNLSRAIKSKSIIKIDSGLYTDDLNYRNIEVIIKKFHNPIFTMQSAFYFYGISDEIPLIPHIASLKNGTKYDKNKVKQYYMDNSILDVGVQSYNYQGFEIRVYSKERLIIELIRHKNSLPYDYYKEILWYYRTHISEMNIQELIDMIELFPKSKTIKKVLREEVL